jgi:elongation factor Ts
MREGHDLQQGWIASSVTPNGQVGALVEVACETDFVAHNTDFQAFVRQCADRLAAEPGTLAEGGLLDRRRAALEQQLGERVVIRRAVRFAISDYHRPGGSGSGVREPRTPGPEDGAADETPDTAG